jgi:hypothetical protein
LIFSDYSLLSERSTVWLFHFLKSWPLTENKPRLPDPNSFIRANGPAFTSSGPEELKTGSAGGSEKREKCQTMFACCRSNPQNP